MGYVFKDPVAAARYQARKQRPEPPQNPDPVKRVLAKILAGISAKAQTASPSARRAGRNHG